MAAQRDAGRTVEVVYEHDPAADAWLARLADDPRAHTFGRTLAEARAAIDEVVGLWYDLESGTYELVERRIPASPVES